jgi:hypothetical protein
MGLSKFTAGRRLPLGLGEAFRTQPAALGDLVSQGNIALTPAVLPTPVMPETTTGFPIAPACPSNGNRSGCPSNGNRPD